VVPTDFRRRIVNPEKGEAQAMVNGVCGICLELTGREVGEVTDYCDKHSVTRAYWQFWREWRVDADKIPDPEGLIEALLRALRVAGGIPAEGHHQTIER
jgi:hypothetical protein